MKACSLLQSDKYRRVRVLLAVLAATGLTACQTNPYTWDKEVGTHIGASLERAGKTDASASTVPRAVSQALLPPLEIHLPHGRRAPLEPRFDLSVNNAQARDVFMGLVRGTPYSMIVSPDLAGTITLHLKNVTVPEALNAIRQAYGYDYRREGNRFFIYGLGMQTRIFHINYLNMVRTGESELRVTSGELTQSETSRGSSNAVPGGTSTSTSQTIPSIRVKTISKADFWGALKSSLTAIIGNAGGRQVVVNPQAGLVIVRAMPRQLEMVRRYLRQTSVAVDRQVILDAKILDVQLNNQFQTGINWAALQGSSVFAQTGGGTIFGGPGTSDIAGQTGNLNPNIANPATPAGSSFINNTAVSAFGGVFSIATKSADFASFLELLQTEGTVHVLSSPRVSTINNQKAVIKVGGDDFFITGVTNTPLTSVGGTTTVSSQVELTPFFSGIALDVTPEINARGDIILHIHPSVSQVVQKDNTFTLNGQVNSLPLASSTIQESDDVVRAKSGQYVVIGGLMKEESTDNNAGVPFLDNIPLLGNLFKDKQAVRVKNELVILLKPTIVDNGEVWEDSIQGSRRHFRDLDSSH
ncbi:MAG: pilus (MSHA type) biogenesis protein MshL [Acidiferrobacterales bacterium]